MRERQIAFSCAVEHWNLETPLSTDLRDSPHPSADSAIVYSEKWRAVAFGLTPN